MTCKECYAKLTTDDEFCSAGCRDKYQIRMIYNKYAEQVAQIGGIRMNREIKCRGKRVDGGGWVYGAYVPQYHSVKHGKRIDAIFFSDDFTTYRIPVIPETVGQCTGLKDKNNTLIFEGDICWDSDWKATFEVFWCEDSLAWKVKFFSDGDTEFLQECAFDNRVKQTAKTVEIIGNIHENSELLEGSGENDI